MYNRIKKREIKRDAGRIAHYIANYYLQILYLFTNISNIRFLYVTRKYIISSDICV